MKVVGALCYRISLCGVVGRFCEALQKKFRIVCTVIWVPVGIAFQRTHRAAFSRSF